MRTWNERFGGANATIQDFESLAEELSGKDHSALFDAWLRTKELPAELDGVKLDVNAADADTSTFTIDDTKRAITEFGTCVTAKGIEFTVNVDGDPLDLLREVGRFAEANPDAFSACASALGAITP